MKSILSGEQKNKNRKNTVFSINKIEIAIPIICLISMTIITFIQVVGRYVFKYSLSWSEEITRFLLIWMAFGGSAYAFRKDAHVSVNVFTGLLPYKVRYYVKIFSGFITILFFVIIGYYGLVHTINQTITLQVSPAMRIPMAVPYSAIPIGSVLIIHYLINKIFKEIKSDKDVIININKE